MAFTGIAKYCQLLRTAAIGVTTGSGPFDLSLEAGRVQEGMIDFEDDEEFFDDIPQNGPFLKIVFPEITGIENITANNAQKIYEIKCELYVSLLQPRGYNLLASPSDFTSDAWINSTGNTSTEERLTDGSASSTTFIVQTVQIPNDSAPYTFSAFFRKTVGATVFPALQLNFEGDTCATPTYASVGINTNTGEAQKLDGDGTPAIAVTDEITEFWKLSITLSNNHQGNDTLHAVIFPAACTANFVINPALENALDVFNPILFNADTISRNILDYSYILQLLDNLNSAWLDSANFTDCGKYYPTVDGFRASTLVSPIDIKPEIGMIEITLAHRSVC